MSVDNDITWGLLNQDLLDHASAQRWGLFRNTKMAMGNLLRNESKYIDALGMYLEVCYLDINNCAMFHPRFGWSEATTWEGNDATLCLVWIDEIVFLMNKIEMDEAQVHNLFKTRATCLKKNAGLPVSVSAAWTKIKKEIVWWRKRCNMCSLLKRQGKYDEAEAYSAETSKEWEQRRWFPLWKHIK